MRFVSTALLFLTTALSAQIVPPGDAGAPRIASNGTNLLVGGHSASAPFAVHEVFARPARTRAIR